MPNLPSTHSSRRRVLRLGTTALAGAALAACTDTRGTDGTGPTSATGTTDEEVVGEDPTAPATPSAASTLTAADFDALPTCQVLPEQGAGPFGLEEQFVRRDITEGVPGHPVRLGLRVVDGTCTAVAGAAVEIWHTDATGDYSAFADGGGGKDEAGGSTFLRGTQVAGDDGIVEFLTIHPGWYPGRCVHIHVTVRTGDALALTTQVVFDDDHTAEILATYEPYVAFGPPDTLVEEDGISRGAATNGTELILTTDAPTDLGTGTLALLNLGLSG